MFGIAWAAFGTPLTAYLLFVMFALAGCERMTATGFYQQWAWCGIGAVIGQAISANLRGLAVAVAELILAAVLWWLSRRRRKRAPRAYGAKSRALLAAAVARMRETLKPRPVFRPAPGGARA